MKRIKHYFFGIGFALSVLASVWGSGEPAEFIIADNEIIAVADSDSIQMQYPFRDRYGDAYSAPGGTSPMYLNDPANIKTEIQYDPDNNRYNINENMGSLFYRNPSYMSFDEFVDQEYKNSTNEYWKQRAGEEDALNKKAFAPKITVNSVIFDRIFGGNTIDIRPQGSAELSFGLNISNSENPSIPLEQRKVTTFDFKEKIQMNVIANIGDKMKLTTNYNTEATFDFENKMKIEYTGYEDDIIKKIEAGNITLPLNSQLIQGSQSLFGIKTQLQFGRLTVTGVFSQQKGKPETINVQGGAQSTSFDIKADQYEENKHFFLSHYFAENYDNTLRNLNHIGTSVNITRVEVWITSRGFVSAQNNQNRNILAFSDLGEFAPDPSQTYVTSNINTDIREPSDSSNNLFTQISPYATQLRNISNSSLIDNAAAAQNFTRTKSYETVENARLLQPSEYTLNSSLGYISLNSKLQPTNVLAVAFEYTVNGKAHRVGELTGTSGITGDSALFVKLIRGKNVSPKFYTWDLMMKNIYSLGGYSISQEKFRLDVLYQDDRIGGNINYIPNGCDSVKGVPLLTLLNLDDVNTQQNPEPDGLFDFISGITINPQAGRIIFPVREPFGNYLRDQFCASDGTIADQYVYDALYDSTKTQAQQQPEKNKFSLRGSFQSSSGSEIPLNAVNIPQGSVKVTAGGIPLVENVDYTVDYTLGRVKIINDGILKSNTPIQINLESNSLFSLQTKSLLGTRLDYVFNKDLQIGGTLLHMYEKPLTQKVNVGDEPISNTVWGLDGNYKRDTRFLTKLLDKLPLYSTKEISTLTFSGEFAQLVPGHSSAVGKGGISYVDDFEGAVTPLDLKNPQSWFLSSVPEQQTEATMFPEGTADSVFSGLNRAKIAWYYVDPIFQQEQTNTPDNVDDNARSNDYVRDVPQTEVFPNIKTYTQQSLTCMNVAFYPSERGPYNYDVSPGIYSKGIDANGNLNNPETRWGGIMRKIESTDFESNNIEFIQFWMMDPFTASSPNDNTGGELYFNIGSLSEDVVKDQHKSFENGLPGPTNNYTTSVSPWGVYPNEQSIVNAFDNDDASRQAQDVGLDGLSTANENAFFQNTFLQAVSNSFSTGSVAYAKAAGDPSTDNYLYFLDPSYDGPGVPVLDRYKRWNGHEGNSVGAGGGSNLTIYSATPDAEDMNRDNNMNVGEDYFQYKVILKPGNLIVGENYITSVIDAPVRYENGTQGSTKWYQFKIPVKFPNRTIGSPEFTTIEYIRMFMKNFQTPIICRFAKLEFLRGEWRRYQFSLLQPGEYTPTPEVPGGTAFDISSVSIEENGSRTPFPYVLPPGIEQERDPSAPALTTINEQSLSLKICDLEDGDARAAYRNTQFDFRSYKKLRMFLHAESVDGETPLNNGDMHAFIRLGSDFNNNYYEYEIPLAITPFGNTSPDAIWPEANSIEIELDKLIEAKLKRNAAMITNTGVSLLAPYPVADGSKVITVKGTPNLSNVRSIMIGIRNPKDSLGTGAKLCGEVWFNELRLSDFDEEGGWAATARVTAKLADLGTMTIVGNHSTAGWGSIEKKVSERDREDKSSYDFSTSIELGKFLPEKSGVKIPLYFGYAESKIKPQYNPLDPDVELDRAIDAAPTDASKDEIVKTVEDYTQRKSFNFTNVRKTKTGSNAKSRIYDVENLNFTYAYTENYQRNYNTEYSIARTYQGIVGYNYNSGSKPIAPFEKTKSATLNSKWLKLIKDININPVPSGLSFRASLDRTYSESQLRNNTGLAFIIKPTYEKTFFMRRNYGLNWDLLKSLKIDYNADAYAIIDEPVGKIDTREERDSIRHSLRNLGRLDEFKQSTKVTYTIPFNKLPLTDWVSGNISYTGDYGWKAAPLYKDSATQEYKDNPWANTIQNSQTWQYGATITFATLYNKIPYLKKLNSPAGRITPPKPKVKLPTDSLKSKRDSLEPKPSILEPVFKGFLKVLMMVKTASANYTETNGTLLPGFIPKPDYIGNDYGFKNSDPRFAGSPQGPSAPGYGFIFGSQDDIRPDAVKYHWLATDSSINSFFTQTQLQNLSLRATIEPLKSFKIELTGNRNYTLNHSEYFKYDEATDRFTTSSPTESGNFSISYLTWNTHFVTDATDYSNANFERFVRDRAAYSRILDAENPNVSAQQATTTGGYNYTQKEVLTFAFLSGYSGRKPSKSGTDLFPSIPLPNWRITYDGLSKMKFFSSFLQSLSLSHGYRSVYSINSFSRNLLYEEDAFLRPTNTDTVGNFIPKYDLQQVTISEQLAPLIGIDMTWKNSLQTRFEIKRDRTVSLAYSNIQVTEVRGIEYTIGLGYKFKKVTLPFRVGGTKKLSNDLTVKADVTLRKNTTILRKVVEGTNQPSAGSNTLGLKLSADYPLNERFNIRAYYDYNSNDPFVSSSYKTSNTNFGLSVRFTLAQ